MFHLHLVISLAAISRWGLHIPTAISSFVNSSLFMEKKRRTHGFCARTLLIRLAPGFFQWLISQLKQFCHNLVDTLFSLLVSSTCRGCVSWALSAMAKSHLLIIQSVPHSQSAGLWQSYQPHPVSRRADGEHSTTQHNKRSGSYFRDLSEVHLHPLQDSHQISLAPVFTSGLIGSYWRGGSRALNIVSRDVDDLPAANGPCCNETGEDTDWFPARLPLLSFSDTPISVCLPSLILGPDQASWLSLLQRGVGHIVLEKACYCNLVETRSGEILRHYKNMCLFVLFSTCTM